MRILISAFSRRTFFGSGLTCFGILLFGSFGSSLVVITIGFARAFAARTADDELASHEILVIENFYSALCFVDGTHFDKGKSFGLLGSRIGDDLGAGDVSDSAEKFFQFVFGGVVAKVADVEATGSHFGACALLFRLG